MVASGTGGPAAAERRVTSSDIGHAKGEGRNSERFAFRVWDSTGTSLFHTKNRIRP